jgi:hypothetical protein
MDADTKQALEAMETRLMERLTEVYERMEKVESSLLLAFRDWSRPGSVLIWIFCLVLIVLALPKKEWGDDYRLARDSLFPGSNGEIVSVVSAHHYFVESTDTNKRHDDGEDSNPDGRFGRNPCRPIYGTFFFLLGFALMKFAFYVSDEPKPSIIFRFFSFGIMFLSVCCIFHSLCLILGIRT